MSEQQTPLPRFTEEEFAALLEEGKNDPKVLSTVSTELLWLASCAMQRQRLMLAGLLDLVPPDSEQAKALRAIYLHALEAAQWHDRWLARLGSVARRHAGENQPVTVAPSRRTH